MPTLGGINKWWIIGGTVGAGVIWYAYRRNKANSASTVPADQIDPNTGLPYASDTSGAFSGTAQGVTPSAYGYIDPTTGAFIGGSGAQQTVIAPSTNAQWAQAVEAYLTQQGWDPLTVAAALGKYLSGQSLSSDQMSIVQAAIAFYGTPPTAVPAPHLQPPAGQQTGTTGPVMGVPAKIPGAFNQRWSDTSLAAALTPPGKNSALMLTQLHRFNHWAPGQVLLGGHVYIKPINVF